MTDEPAPGSYSQGMLSAQSWRVVVVGLVVLVASMGCATALIITDHTDGVWVLPTLGGLMLPVIYGQAHTIDKVNQVHDTVTELANGAGVEVVKRGIAEDRRDNPDAG